MSRYAHWEWVNHRTLVLPSPAACCFIGVDAFLQMALAAYNGASCDFDPPDGEPWIDANGTAWGGPENFYDGLMRRLEEGLRSAAVASGCAIESRLSSDEIAEMEASSAEIVRWLAQGGAASLPAVGPAPVLSADADITHSADRFLFTPVMQELPVALPCSNNQKIGGHHETE